MARSFWIGAIAGTVMCAGLAAIADDSCLMANNGMCEEEFFGLGYCPRTTDTADCADSQVLPASEIRRLNEYDVRYLLPYQLRLARNEIFARHGYRFNSADLQHFFGVRSWYTPIGQSVSLSEVEQANVEYLRQIEDGALNPAQQRAWTPDGTSLPPWTAWLADVVHADGAVDGGIVDGVRGRAVDLETGWTVVVRPDVEDSLYYGPDNEIGAIAWWGLFPPILLEPFVQALGIVPQPIGRENLFGETVTRVRLDWEDEDSFTSLHGEAWLTDDGIFLQVDVGGIYAECCGGDEEIPWRLRYHLENLERGRADPALLVPPPFTEWSYAG